MNYFELFLRKSGLRPITPIAAALNEQNKFRTDMRTVLPTRHRCVNGAQDRPLIQGAHSPDKLPTHHSTRYGNVERT